MEDPRRGIPGAETGRAPPRPSYGRGEQREHRQRATEPPTIEQQSAVDSSTVEHRLSVEGADQLLLAGVNDSHLTALSRLADCRVILRGDELILSGPPEAVEEVVPVAKRMVRQARLHEPLDVGDVERYYREASDGQGPTEFDASSEEAEEVSVTLPQAGKLIQPKSEGQRRYLDAMQGSDVTVGIGPAGTGKTYLAVAKAVAALSRKRVRKIILTRPAVEAGEELGFLPGDIREKVDPYLRPLYDALGDMMPREEMQRAIEQETVEIAPLAYMRGRTLSDAFLILDEAQNATTAQMKMFLTRLGLNSQVVITGDKTQIDLSHPDASGLLEIEDLLRGIDGIEFVYLSETDVVRHRLVKEIIRAYRDEGDGGPS